MIGSIIKLEYGIFLQVQICRMHASVICYCYWQGYFTTGLSGYVFTWYKYLVHCTGVPHIAQSTTGLTKTTSPPTIYVSVGWRTRWVMGWVSKSISAITTVVVLEHIYIYNECPCVCMTYDICRTHV